MLKTFMLKKIFNLTSIILFISFLASKPVFAAPTFVNQAQNLANDALTWVLVLVPVTASLMVGYHAWMKSISDGEPTETASRNKKMKNVLIYSAVAEVASAITKLVLGYFS